MLMSIKALRGFVVGEFEMGIHKSRNTARIGMNFEHIVAGIDMFTKEPGMVSSQYSSYPHDIAIVRHFDLPFEAMDVQKHYALLDSRTAMNVHTAEESARNSNISVSALRWNY